MASPSLGGSFADEAVIRLKRPHIPPRSEADALWRPTDCPFRSSSDHSAREAFTDYERAQCSSLQTYTPQHGLRRNVVIGDECQGASSSQFFHRGNYRCCAHASAETETPAFGSHRNEADPCRIAPGAKTVAMNGGTRHGSEPSIRS